jgi:hypothetical protein
MVHWGLLATFGPSLLVLVLGTSLLVHEFVGVLFAACVVMAMRQRRRISEILIRHLKSPRQWLVRFGRLAWADVALALTTANVIVSGFVDIVAGRPVFLSLLGPRARIRWHSLSVVILLVFLTVHVVRRCKSMRVSQIRSSDACVGFLAAATVK